MNIIKIIIIKEANKMNINIEIDDELHRKLKIKAANEEKTLKEIISEVLEKGLKK